MCNIYYDKCNIPNKRDSFNVRGRVLYKWFRLRAWVYFFNQVDIQLNKRFYISPGIQFTNHAQTYSMPPWNLNYVTGGVDVFTNINYLIISKICLKKYSNSNFPQSTNLYTKN